ncbi:MAG: ABC transporter ATP-binding protein [Acidobacteria bacterium]|nr:ABC transporter ATP-binding protein [Acidobacteriota bacterium]
MLAVEGLRAGYGTVEILGGVDLAVHAGEVVSLVGPNGTGKSTLLKCVNGIMKPTAGRVTVGGRAIETYQRRELARAIAYVPQSAGSAMSLPVIDLVGLGRAPHRGLHPGQHDREVVLDVIERLHLQPLAFRLFGALSGGERQRVLLARALAQESHLLLLDEPTNALDLRHQLETMTIVRELAKERGYAVLLAIHDLALAGRFSDRLVMLSAGRVHVEGYWDRVITPGHLQSVYGVGALVGTDNGLPYVIPTKPEGRE